MEPAEYPNQAERKAVEPSAYHAAIDLPSPQFDAACKERLDEIRARRDAVAEWQPWDVLMAQRNRVIDSIGDAVAETHESCGTTSAENIADFIAGAWDDLGYLLGQLDAALAHIEKLEAEQRRLQKTAHVLRLERVLDTLNQPESETQRVLRNFELVVAANIRAETAEATVEAQARELAERVPAGWHCGCGWTNGLNFATCSWCGRMPNEGGGRVTFHAGAELEGR